MIVKYLDGYAPEESLNVTSIRFARVSPGAASWLKLLTDDGHEYDATHLFSDATGRWIATLPENW